MLMVKWLPKMISALKQWRRRNKRKNGLQIHLSKIPTVVTFYIILNRTYSFESLSILAGNRFLSFFIAFF